MHRLLSTAILLVVWCGAVCPAAAADPRQNVLLILGDNWAWPHAGALGDRTVRTPTFDRLAREGVLFTHTFCPVPSCSPTRSCILTGRAAHQLEDAASLWSKFPRHLRVYPDLLAEAGYHVGSMGKAWSPGIFKDFGWAENPAGKQYTDFATFLAARGAEQPFCFWMGFTLPATHTWVAGAGTAKGLRAETVEVPACLPDVPEVRQNMLDYYEAVERLDTAVGEALTTLETSGLADNTVIIFASDNGWQFPRGLANVYDTGTRVPLVVRWHKQFQAGGRVDQFISLTDLAPTILELAGIKPLPEMTGSSFVDLLIGRPSATPRDCVFLERERHANVRRGDLSYPIRAIRTREFLYIRNLRPDRWPAGDPEAYWAVGDYGDVDPSPTKDYILAHQNELKIKPFFTLNFAKRPAEELYDLRKDPAQVRNVAGQPDYAANQQMLAARLDQWMRDTADPRIDPANDAWDKYLYHGRRRVEAGKQKE